MKKTAWTYDAALSLALTGLVLAGAGLWLAMLSDPARFSMNVRNDRFIDAYAGGGFFCAIAGVGMFLLAVRRMPTYLSLEKRRQTNISIGLGLIIQLAGIVLIQIVPGQHGLGLLLVLASLPLFALGANYYSRAKGYSGTLGLLGLLGAFGLIILILLPSQNPFEHQENEG